MGVMVHKETRQPGKQPPELRKPGYGGDAGISKLLSSFGVDGSHFVIREGATA